MPERWRCPWCKYELRQWAPSMWECPGCGEGPQKLGWSYRSWIGGLLTMLSMGHPALKIRPGEDELQKAA